MTANETDAEHAERMPSRVLFSEFVADGIREAVHAKMHGEWEGQNVTLGQIREVMLDACRERTSEFAEKLAGMIAVSRDPADPTRVNIDFPLVDLRDLEEVKP